MMGLLATSLTTLFGDISENGVEYENGFGTCLKVTKGYCVF